MRGGRRGGNPTGPETRPDPGGGPGFTVGALVIVILALAVGAPILLAPGMLQGAWGPPGPAMTLRAGAWADGHLQVEVASVAARPIEAPLLGFKIENSTRSVYFAGPSGSWRNISGANTTLTYRDHDGDGLAGAGDRMDITVSPPVRTDRIRGCTLKVLLGAEVLATLSIP